MFAMQQFFKTDIDIIFGVDERWDAVTRQCEGFAVSEALPYQHVLHMYCYMSKYPKCSYIKFVLRCNSYY